MQSSQCLQVESAQATSAQDIGSSKKSWLLKVGFGLGCFALGVASGRLVLPGASQEQAHHVLATANGDMGFNPPMVVPLRQNPATDPQFRPPPSFLPRVSRTSIAVNQGPSKVKNENPDDFATYLAKRQAAADGREWVPEGGAAPAAAAPAPPAYAPAPAAPAAAAPAAGSSTSKVKNENPDDFATYLAKRQAASEGREWVPAGGAAPAAAAPAPAYAPAAPAYVPAAAAPTDAGPPPQDAGDVKYDAAWGGSPKAHTSDPTPVSAEGNSLGKAGAIASGDSFEEYMKKRAAQR